MKNEPRTLEDCPEYLAATAKKTELQTELAATRSQLAAAYKKMATPAARLEDEADALLRGEDLEQASYDAAQKQVGAIEHRLNVLAVALERQERVILEARAEASKAICKSYAPEFLARAKKIRDACAAAAKLGQEQRDFLVGLEHSGVFMYEPISTRPAMDEATLWKLSRTVEDINGVIG